VEGGELGRAGIGNGREIYRTGQLFCYPLNTRWAIPPAATVQASNSRERAKCLRFIHVHSILDLHMRRRSTRKRDPCLEDLYDSRHPLQGISCYTSLSLSLRFLGSPLTRSALSSVKLPKSTRSAQAARRNTCSRPIIIKAPIPTSRYVQPTTFCDPTKTVEKVPPSGFKFRDFPTSLHFLISKRTRRPNRATYQHAPLRPHGSPLSRRSPLDEAVDLGRNVCRPRRSVR
jgi:hypothetical protein